MSLSNILFVILFMTGIGIFIILLIGMAFIGIFYIVLFVDSFNIQDLVDGLLFLGGSSLVLTGLAYAVDNI